MASLWLRVDGETVAADLDSPAVAVAGLEGWMREIAATAQAASREAGRPRPVVAESPEVRNLLAVAEPGPASLGETIVALVAACSQEQRTALQRQARLALLDRDRQAQHRQRERLAGHLHETAALLETVGRIEQAARTNGPLRSLAETLEELLGCQTVAVARARGRRLRGPVVVGGRADADPRSRPVTRLRSALAETLARGTLAQHPAEAAPQQLALAAAARDCRLAHAWTLPLLEGDPRDHGPARESAATAAGVLLVGWSEAADVGDAAAIERLLTAAQHPLGSALGVAYRGRRRGIARLAHAVGRRPLKAAAIAAAVVGLGVAAAVPVPYRITCRSECQPVQTRAAVAPHEGLLARALVEVGETVAAGDVLGRMDVRELRSERAGLLAERARAAAERDAERAAGRVAESYRAALEVDRLNERLRVIGLRLDRAEIRSPVDGLVLASPLERGERLPVRIGELLFEVAAVDPMRLEVAVPANRIDHVAVGQTVRFRPEGRVEALEGTIARVRPRSEVRDDRAVFIAEVTLANEAARLRPGMEGTARVLTPSQPLAWCLLHEAVEYVAAEYGW